jgi:hypothetical protein
VKVIVLLYVRHRGDTNTYIGFPADDTFTITTFSSERMRIDSSGNVGIGVIPEAWTAFNPVLRVGDGGAFSGVGVSNFRMFANTYYDVSGYKRIGAGLATQYEQASGTHRWSTAATGLPNSTISWSERMRITSGGSVGIGTDNPGGLLHVSSGTSGDAVVIIESDTDNSDENDNPHLELRQDGGGIKAKLGIEGLAGSTYSNSINNATYLGTVFEQPLQFITGDTGGVQTAKMTIEPNSGDVGIGTTSPASKLDVNGGIRMADDSSTASASNVGTLRYRTISTNSFVDMCMQTGATTYEWVNIVQNNW